MEPYKPRRVVTVDLDSTVSDTRHRHRLIDRVNGTDWDAYSLACVDDDPILGALAMVKLLATLGVEIHFVTGRTVAAEQATRTWLEKQGIIPDGLWMDETPDGDHFAAYGGHAEYKLARIQDVMRATGTEVIFHIDDWAEVAVLLEQNGIPCICVRTPQEMTALVEQVQELA